jgi:CDP-glycerol glycerophosphotransferase
MADLLLIADVLITDYSSAMFDFAVTGRPMLFFTYDLERYRDRLRGFYFDFEAEAPGPLLRTSDDVIDALRSLEDVNRGYRAAYDAFAARFCGLDDGRAAARAVDWLLSHSA